MKYFSQFLLFIMAVAVLLGLQYQYWLGENGHYQSQQLAAELADQQRQLDNQLAENAILQADVHDLKTGLEAVEEHARIDLGLIKPNETFVQITTAPQAYASNTP